MTAKRLKILYYGSPLTSNIKSNNNNIKNIINKALKSFIALSKVRKTILNTIKIFNKKVDIKKLNELLIDYIKKNNITITRATKEFYTL